ncbi:hypothetical protein DL96DRAFT_1576375 [Flagelloscypha sp. PMI_526]|nr:hypothetical protein DL96DRAFT_1576375 [Flagelloscypha sp. PMI_526]
MLSSNRLPYDLWREIFSLFANLFTRRLELLPYLTINKAAFNSIEPRIYHTLLLRSNAGHKFLTTAWKRAEHIASDPRRARYVKTLKVMIWTGWSRGVWGNDSLGLHSLLYACSGITRLSCTFTLHTEPQIIEAVNALPRLQMLEMDLKEFVSIYPGPSNAGTDKQPLKSPPAWAISLTTLALECDRVNDSDIEHCNIVSNNTGALLAALLVTSPPTLSRIVVEQLRWIQPTLSNEWTQREVDSLEPALSDKRVSVFFGKTDSSPFDDWSGRLASNADGSFDIWECAARAAAKRHKAFTADGASIA